MFCWFDVREDDDSVDSAMFLYMHICGDFGTSGFPGTFKIFFTDVVVNMARSMAILTLPMPVFVDDMALIGAVTPRLEKEWDDFKAFLRSIGVPMKSSKSSWPALFSSCWASGGTRSNVLARWTPKSSINIWRCSACFRALQHCRSRRCRVVRGVCNARF